MSSLVDLLLGGAIAAGSGAFAGELAVRLAIGVPLRQWTNFIVDRSSLLKVHTLNQYDPVLGWVLKENLHSGHAFYADLKRNGIAFLPDFDLWTGEFGVRMNQPALLPVPRGAILVVGSSFAAGSDVPSDATWPALLEQRLGEAVVNAAAGGWGSDQVILRAESLLPALRPRLVVVSCNVNALALANYRVYAGVNKPCFVIEDGRLTPIDQPVPPATARSNRLSLGQAALGYSYLVCWIMDRLGHRKWCGAEAAMVPVNDDPAPVARERTGEVTRLLMERLNETAARQGCRVAFFMQYEADSIFGRQRPFGHVARLMDALRLAGMPVIDPWEPLVALCREDRRRFDSLYHRNAEGQYGHMTRAGNALMADILGAGLARHRLTAVPALETGA